MSKNKPQGFEISDGYNLLMLRTEEGDANEVLSVLNGIKQIDVNAMNKKGYTALALAVKNGFLDIATLLISRGANVNTRNNSGQSPLFLSCWCNYLDLVKLLLEHGAEINTSDQRGWSPLTIAAYHGNSDIVELLLQNNADVTLKDSFGKRAIHRAKDPKIIKILQAAEAKCGITSNISPEKAEKPNKIVNFKTEPNLASSTADPKASLMTTISDILERKQKNASPSHRRVNSPQLSYNASPVAKTSKTVRPWQTGPKNKKSNLSFDLQESTDIRSPIRYSTTPQASEAPTGRFMSPKAVKTDASQLREPVEVNNESPLGDREKKGFDESFSAQMKLVSEKVQELVEQKIALELEKQVQEYQVKLKQGIEKVVKAKIAQSFGELQESFNEHLKLLLNKLGYGENVVREARFVVEKEMLVPKGSFFKEDLVKGQGDKDRRLMESKIQRMEKDIFGAKSSPGKGNQGKSEVRGITSPSNNRVGTKNKANEQLSRGVKTTTESLLAFSKNRINEVMQVVEKTLQENLTAEIETVAHAAEEGAKEKMEDMMNNKFSQLSEFMANAPLSSGDDKSFNDDSFIADKNVQRNEESKVNENRIEEVKKEDEATGEIKLSPPKVEKIKIPEKRYSFFKEKSEKMREYLDAVKEEEESVKEQQTTTELRDSRLTDKGMGQILTTDANEDIQEQYEEQSPQKNQLSKEEQRSLNNLTPSQSESSGTLSSEFRLEGLKNYFGNKRDSEGKIGKLPGSNRASAPTSIVSTNRSQQGGASNIPMHTFGFTNVKTSTFQYDFDD